MTTTDEFYMRQALSVAAYARGRTSPNPLVGAVVVKGGRIVAQGWHRRAGTPHAEVHALRQAGVLAVGSTMYVTLEPCAHFGRTPPCSQTIIDAGVNKVVIAAIDPNPLVAGRGVAMLQRAGLEVVTGVLEAEAARLNEVFFKWIKTGRPFTLLKTAMTVDGKTATVTGSSKWISNTSSRLLVHRLRDQYDAIMVGINTVLADDPQLTARLPEVEVSRNPVRVIVDSMARLPLNAAVVMDKTAPTIVAVTTAAPPERVGRLRSAGVEVIVGEPADGHVDLPKLFDALGERGITSVLVEGGAELSYSLLAAKLIDKLAVFIAPKIVGGAAAPTFIGGSGIELMQNAVPLTELTAQTVDGDILLTGYLNYDGG